MKGEITKIYKYLQNKKITISVVNNVDKRMFTKFMRSKWNYWDKFRTLKWVSDNLIPDRKIIKLVGYREWAKLNLEEKIEVKANFMIRQHVWKRLHLFNKQFTKQWMIKYAPETDFLVEIETK